MIKHQQSKEGVTKSYELGPERQLYHTNGSDRATRGLVYGVRGRAGGIRLCFCPALLKARSEHFREFTQHSMIHKVWPNKLFNEVMCFGFFWGESSKNICT